MKKIYKYYVPALWILGLSSCSLEAPFQGEMKEGFGQLSKFAFELEVSGVQNTTTRDDNSNLLNDFDIVIQKTGSTPVTKYSDKYSNLPDVIALEAGNYKVTATYGENLEAEFEKPHYLGTSTEFEVKHNEITTDIGKIKCYLNNVKVSVKFHPTLVQHMGDYAESAYVDVKVKNTGGKSLRFTIEHAENETAGYFKHDEENTLVATFHGIVDGIELEETKTFNNVDKGNYYQITFIRHEYNGEESGDVSGKINVDASVTITNIETNVPSPEEEMLDQSERPTETPENSENPGTEEPTPGPDVPEDPDKEPIEIYAMPNPDPTGNKIDLDIVNNITANSYVALKVICEKKIKYFKVEIKEPLANFLDGILPATFDLTDPGEDLGSFQELGLIGEDETSLYDKKEVEFNVTKFMGILCNLDPIKGQINEFIIEVTDQENNVKKVSLKLLP